MRVFAVTMLLLALAGCGGGEKAENAALPEPLPSGPRLGAVPLDAPIRATDAALTWSLEIAPGAIVMTRFAGRGPRGGVTQFYPVSPASERDKAVWTTHDPAGEQVVITLADAKCSEAGEPAIERPLTADVRIGNQHMTGCAGPAPAEAADGEVVGNKSGGNVK